MIEREVGSVMGYRDKAKAEQKAEQMRRKADKDCAGFVLYDLVYYEHLNRWFVVERDMN